MWLGEMEMIAYVHSINTLFVLSGYFAFLWVMTFFINFIGACGLICDSVRSLVAMQPTFKAQY
jgi:hypothetical protein